MVGNTVTKTFPDITQSHIKLVCGRVIPTGEVLLGRCEGAAWAWQQTSTPHTWLRGTERNLPGGVGGRTGRSRWLVVVVVSDEWKCWWGLQGLCVSVCVSIGLVPPRPRCCALVIVQIIRLIMCCSFYTTLFMASFFYNIMLVCILHHSHHLDLQYAVRELI